MSTVLNTRIKEYLENNSMPWPILRIECGLNIFEEEYLTIRYDTSEDPSIPVKNIEVDVWRKTKEAYVPKRSLPEIWRRKDITFCKISEMVSNVATIGIHDNGEWKYLSMSKLLNKYPDNVVKELVSHTKDFYDAVFNDLEIKETICHVFKPDAAKPSSTMSPGLV